MANQDAERLNDESGRPLRILFCVNWPVDRLNERDSCRFSPDYLISGEPYWFFKHVKEHIVVDVLDCRSFARLDRLERRWAHCYPSKGFLAWLRSRHYDFVLSHGGQMGLVVGLLQYIFRKSLHPPHVMFDVGAISGRFGLSKRGLVYAGCRLAVKSLAATICHSSRQLEYYRELYPEVANVAHFIPLGVDTDEFRPDACEQSDEIICVGHSELNLELLLRVYASLQTKTRLVLLGIPGGLIISQPGVVCVPRVNIDVMRQFLRRAKFFVLPLPSVDFCIGQQRFLQAMALGKAALLPAIPAVVDYIRDGETGFLYDANSEDSLRKKLQALLSADEQVQRVGLAARSAIESHFSEEIMARNVMSLLRGPVRNMALQGVERAEVVR